MNKTLLFLLIVFLGFSMQNQCYAQHFKKDSLIIIEKTNAGVKHYEEGNLDSSKTEFLELLTILKKLKTVHQQNPFIDESKINAMDYISAILYAQGNMFKAIAYADTVLKYFEQQKDSFSVSLSLNNIAFMYQAQNMYEKAHENYAKALNILNKLPSEESDIYIGVIYNNIGLIYERKNSYDTALVYYEKSLKIRRKIGDKRGISESLNNIGNTLRKMDRIDEALENLLEALKIKEELNDAGGLSYTLNNVSIIYYLKGDMKKSLEYALRSKDEALKTGNIEALAQISNSLSKNFFELKNYKEAYNHLKEFIFYNDSLTSVNNKKALYKHQVQYEFDKKEALIKAEQEKKELVNYEKLRRQKLITYGAIIGLLLLIVIIIIIYRSYTIKKKSNINLTNKNIEITKQKHLIEEQHQEITDSINYAKRIQTALLTSDEYWKEIAPEHFVFFKPKDVVSGDFFWAFQTENNLAIWVTADCTGHGVPGAFMSMLGIGFLNEIVVENNITNPVEILNSLRNKIIKALEQKGADTQQKDGMDLALCVWDKNANTLEYSGANNPLWMVRELKHITEEQKLERGTFIKENATKGLVEFKADKQPVGFYREKHEQVSFTSTKIQLEKGDAIYTFSDGFADQFGGEKGKKYKYLPFKELLVSINEKPFPEQKEILNQEFESWKGNLEQVDDVCIIGIKVV